MRMHPYALLDRLTALPAVDFAELVRRLAVRAPLRPRPQLEHASAGELGAPMAMDELARAARAALTALGAPPPAPAPASTATPPASTKARTPSPARIEALIAAPAPDPRQRPEKSTRFGLLWKRGVPGIGHRDAALYALARDSLYRHRPKRRAVAQIQGWIQRGGIAASRAAARPGGVEHEIADVPRRVGIVYATHPHPARPAPVHLSAREVRAITALAQQQAKVTGFPAARLGELLLRALPVFKGCQRAGLPAARVHCREWEQWGGPSYARLRDATGIFTATSGYVAQSTLREAGRNPADAFARNWSTSFAFDPSPVPAPIRRLGGSYRAAKLAAELAACRARSAASGTSKKVHERPATAHGPAIDSTPRIFSGSHPLQRHIQTAPLSAAPTVPGKDPVLVLDPDPLLRSSPSSEPTGDVVDRPPPSPSPSVTTSSMGDCPLPLPFASALGTPVTKEIGAQPHRLSARPLLRGAPPSARRSRSSRAAPRRSSDPDP
jgi:hypothetical protein